MGREDPQINLRLSEEEIEILEAAGWVQKSSKVDIAKTAVLALIDSLRSDPAIAEAIAARRTAERATDRKVTAIGSKTTKRRDGS